MKKLILLALTLLSVFLLTGCGNSGEKEVENTTVPSKEATDGDFVYRIISEKDVYKEDEPVKLYAELEYVGDKDSISIFHAASPFYFEITEKTRNFKIPYPMNTPLIETTLEKGKPLRVQYSKSGGYSNQDEKEYVKFMKEFLTGDRFPVGNYEVFGNADFYIEENEAEQDFTIKAKIEFKVEGSGS